MPIFFNHVTLTREGLDEIKTLPDRIEANRKLWEDNGGRVLSWRVVLGD